MMFTPFGHGVCAFPPQVSAHEAWGWAAATGVLWGLSYFFWRRPAGRDHAGEHLTAPRRLFRSQGCCAIPPWSPDCELA
jgi:hypothetical protein